MAIADDSHCAPPHVNVGATLLWVVSSGGKENERVIAARDENEAATKYMLFAESHLEQFIGVGFFIRARPMGRRKRTIVLTLDAVRSANRIIAGTGQKSNLEWLPEVLENRWRNT